MEGRREDGPLRRRGELDRVDRGPRSPAAALSITDPVFGDIQVWQFIVLTAGYWLGIEYYLDNKYDEKEQSPDSIMPKVSAAKKNSFAEAKAEQEAKEAESAE